MNMFAVTKTEALVELDYASKEANELTLKKGDIIKDVIKKQEGWCEGVLNGKKGLFPDNFVKLIDKESNVTLRNKKDLSQTRQCKALFSYQQVHEDELTLQNGDIIEVVCEEEPGWWRGRLNGKEGLFPSNFVTEITSGEDITNNIDTEIVPILPPKPTKFLCQALFDYEANHDDELSLKKGDIITFLSKDKIDHGWWKGELNGKIGVFPDNFVEILESTSPTEESKSANTKEPVPKASSATNSTTVTSHRKSLEEKVEKNDVNNQHVTPPVPGKKPFIPLKKSPSATDASSKLFAGIRKKLVDVVDGAASSKGQQAAKVVSAKGEAKVEETSENAFDSVERSSMLQDVRATRAKAPGRRPPSVVFKEGEPGVLNGNSDHIHLDALAENAQQPLAENLEVDVKPKIRMWEKNKAPWLEEMKLNQAKRGPATDKAPNPEAEVKPPKTSQFEKDPTSSPVDNMSKSVGSLSNRVKTSPNELEKGVANIRTKLGNSTVQAAPRPQTIHSTATPNLSTSPVQKPSPPTFKVSPGNTANKIPPKPQVIEKSPEVAKPENQETISFKQYSELLERLEKLEHLLNQQNEEHKATVQRLQRNVQLEAGKVELLKHRVDELENKC